MAVSKVSTHLKHLIIDCMGASEENISNVGIANKKEGNVCMEHLCFPYFELDNLASMSHINSYQPLISLLIYDSSFDSFLSNKKLMEVAPKKLLQSKFYILFKVHEYLTSEDTEIHGAKDHDKLERTHKINMLAYFFASVEQRSRIDVACMSSDKIIRHHFDNVTGPTYKFIPKRVEKRIEKVCDRIIDKLGLKKCKYANSTVLLLSISKVFSVHLCIFDRLLRKLYKSAPDGHEISWMHVGAAQFTVASGSKEDDKYPYLMALRISGPGVKSWNTKFFYNEDQGDIARKLHELKDKVTPKQHCIGLINSPKCCESKCSHELHPYGDNHNLMQCVKLVFPDIPFVGLFEDDLGLLEDRHSYILEDRLPNVGDVNDIFKPNDGEGHVTDLVYIATVMIISYD